MHLVLIYLVQALGRDFCTLDQRVQLGPRNLVVQTAAQTTVGGGYDLVWANNRREVGNAVCNQLWVLNHVGGVCNNAWVQQNVVWKFDVLPDLPLVSVAWGGCLEGVAADLGAQNLFQDVTERHVKPCVKDALLPGVHNVKNAVLGLRELATELVPVVDTGWWVISR